MFGKEVRGYASPQRGHHYGDRFRVRRARHDPGGTHDLSDVESRPRAPSSGDIQCARKVVCGAGSRGAADGADGRMVACIPRDAADIPRWPRRRHGRRQLDHHGEPGARELRDRVLHGEPRRQAPRPEGNVSPAGRDSRAGGCDCRRRTQVGRHRDSIRFRVRNVEPADCGDAHDSRREQRGADS